LRERDHSKDICIDRRILLKWILKKLDESVDLIDVAWDRDRWQVLVNVVVNFQVL
jgi:hypothetical protein